MADNIQREPVVLIDKGKQQEAHLIAASHYTFEDLMLSARRINVGVFEGEWDLSYINPETQQAESIDPQKEVGDYFDRNITTFYWNYRLPAVHPASPNFNRSYTTRINNPVASPFEGLAAANAPQYANFMQRLVAAIIDSFIFMFVIGVLAVFTLGIALLFSWALAWVYYAAFESSKHQATPGKIIMGLMVTDMNGNRITFAQAMLRGFGHVLSAVFFIGYFWMLFSDKNQGLHDVIAGTLVVTGRPPTQA